MFAVGLHTCTAVARSLCVSWAFLFCLTGPMGTFSTLTLQIKLIWIRPVRAQKANIRVVVIAEALGGYHAPSTLVSTIVRARVISADRIFEIANRIVTSVFDCIRNEHNYSKFSNTYRHKFLTYLTE